MGVHRVRLRPVLTLRRLRRALERIWSSVPDVGCKGLCSDSCGPVAVDATAYRRTELWKQYGLPENIRGPRMSNAEWTLLLQHLGREPGLAPGSIRCPLLTADGRCSVYDIRPLVCRVWGAVVERPETRCPHGCRPAVPFTHEQAQRIFKRAGGLMG